MRTLRLDQARRIALAAQGFGDPAPRGPVTARHVQRVLDRVGIVQLDSVNVVSRSHYLPFWSRLGSYDRAVVDRAGTHAPRRTVEYWAHEASLVSPPTHRLLRWRMDRWRQEAWGGMRGVARDHPALVEAVYDQVAQRGPVTAVDLEAAMAEVPAGRGAHWGWNWSNVKTAVEQLFWAGRVSSAGRTGQFARRYDLTERVLPPAVARAPDPDPADAIEALMLLAARAHGIATESCLRDYARLGPADSRPALARLVAKGHLEPVAVPGWRGPVYLTAGTAVPRSVAARALLSPFDSLIWSRRRVEALFGFRYRLEIYVPRHRRVHGYYVLPFLLGDRLVARVDLKADRAAGVLQVRSAWAEPEVGAGDGAIVASELAAELEDFATWSGLAAISVAPRGDLAAALSARV